MGEALFRSKLEKFIELYPLNLPSIQAPGKRNKRSKQKKNDDSTSTSNDDSTQAQDDGDSEDRPSGGTAENVRRARYVYTEKDGNCNSWSSGGWREGTVFGMDWVKRWGFGLMKDESTYKKEDAARKKELKICYRESKDYKWVAKPAYGR